MNKRDLLSLSDLDTTQIRHIIDRAVKIAQSPLAQKKTLEDKAVGIYFRKTSTRTRTSFMLGAARLGASVVVYGPGDLQINTGETIQDTARVLSGYLDALVLRTAEPIEEMKVFANQPRMAVINAMSDIEHPTQALADLATLQAHFAHLDGLHMLYLGEGNSTAVALALAMSKIQGMRLTLLTPADYGLPLEFLQIAQCCARQHEAKIEQFHDLKNLPEGVDVVYATRWQTTGNCKKDPQWRKAFQPYRVTQDIMKRVSKRTGTIFMHDLPAVRGEDVESEVLDGPQSIAFRQAQNKLFGAMAALEWCMLDT
ncbi:MAG TPA: hypothetical protein VFV38_19820 [Ktedonobacteraceae bacterium]|nr:hypothetical protein [Ktedonobacteraceae bacterium]